MEVSYYVLYKYNDTGRHKNKNKMFVPYHLHPLALWNGMPWLASSNHSARHLFIISGLSILCSPKSAYLHDAGVFPCTINPAFCHRQRIYQRQHGGADVQPPRPRNLSCKRQVDARRQYELRSVAQRYQRHGEAGHGAFAAQALVSTQSTEGGCDGPQRKDAAQDGKRQHRVHQQDILLPLIAIATDDATPVIQEAKIRPISSYVEDRDKDVAGDNPRTGRRLGHYFFLSPFFLLFSRPKYNDGQARSRRLAMLIFATNSSIERRGSLMQRVEGPVNQFVVLTVTEVLRPIH